MEIAVVVMGKAYDVCVVGGGIVGLWVARQLGAAGLSVVLVERGRCGGGASGGVLGALTAHAPDNWNAKKQFQFDALTELPQLIADIESATGLETGYAQCGRVMPIRRESFLAQAERRVTASKAHWRVGDQTYGYDIGAADTAGWLAAEAAPLGVVHDGLAARVDPRRYVAALKAALGPNVAIEENWPFARFDAGARRVVAGDGVAAVVADQIVLAAGYETFACLKPIVGRTIGGGVKGQAAVFQCAEAAGQPLIYDDGIYVVAHDGGRCAVGSTTEKEWRDASTPDASRVDFIERARELCPALRHAALIGRWAGIRPRSHKTDPIVGRLAPDSPVLVATGGYKITFGIAHRMAQCIVGDIVAGEDRTALPPSFRPAHHLDVDEPDGRAWQ